MVDYKYFSKNPLHLLLTQKENITILWRASIPYIEFPVTFTPEVLTTSSRSNALPVGEMHLLKLVVLVATRRNPVQHREPFAKILSIVTFLLRMY